MSIDEIRELSTITGVLKSGAWNILENLGWLQNFWRFVEGMQKHFELFYHKYACQYYGMTR